MKDGAEGEILVSTLAVVELGVDEDGDKITSCVIRPSDKPPGGSNGPRLSDQTAIALNLLRRAIEDSGEKPLRAIIFLWAPGLSGKPFGGSTIITGPDRGRTRNQTKEPDRRHLSEPSKSSRISSR